MSAGDGGNGSVGVRRGGRTNARDVRVQLAGREALDEVMALHVQVQDLHAELRPDRFRPADAEALRAALVQVLDEGNLLLVARQQVAAVGYAVVSVRERPGNAYARARSVLYVEQICVDAGHRSHGVGRALIEAARDEARQRGIRHLELDMWTANEPARRAFAALGFRTFNEHMEMDL